MNKMQQSAQQAMNAPPSTPLNLVSTEQIQKYLDENKNLIMAILECQKMGKMAECAQYQAILQKNLMYLAAIADAQPPGSSTPSQISTSSVGNSQPQQTQASAVQQQQPGGPVAKMPFQLNALRPHDQQNQQLLQFQQQQMQGHFSLGGGGGGGANMNNGLHMPMHHPVAGPANMMGFRGNQPSGLEASPGNGQGNSGLGRDARE